MGRDHPNAGLADGLATAMEKNLDEETRLAILAIKDAGEPETKTRGVDIYKAVLRDGVRSTEQFKDWLKVNPIAEIEEWRP